MSDRLWVGSHHGM